MLGAAGAGSYDLGGEASAATETAGYGQRPASNLPALKQVLASRLGMTPETFSRAMRTLTGAGLVASRARRCAIPDVAALDAYSRSQSIV